MVNPTSDVTQSFDPPADERTTSIRPNTSDQIDPGAEDPAPVTPPGEGFALDITGYEVEGELGRGGMGVVYKARQHGLNRPVALKMVLAGTHAGADELIRFLAEAETAARLQHQGIAQIFDSGRVRGLPFFTMEYVDGGSLAERLRGGAVPPPDAARIALQLATAVAYAHAAGVIHRDLKPANILLTADGTPKITDFGLAKRLDGDHGLTRTGSVYGTPAYMPPEQARGDLKSVGRTGDVYSLGAILYELLTGRPPFRASNPVATLALVLNAAPDRPRQVNPAVPRDLETVCLKCLEKDPARRYESAAALAEDLQRFLDGRTVLARRAGWTERLWRWARRNPAVAALLSAVFGLLTAVAAVAVVAALRIDDARRRADTNADAARESLALAEEARGRAAGEAAAAEEVSVFLAGLFEPQDRLSIGAASLGYRAKAGDSLRARDLLDRGVVRLENDAVLKTRPVVRARLLHQVGGISFGLGDLKAARRLLVQALDLRRRHLPPDHPDLARTLIAVAHTGYLIEDEAAADQYREAIRILQRADPDGMELAEAETGLALCGDLWEVPADEAIRLFRHATALRRTRLGADDFRTVTTEILLAWVYYDKATLRAENIVEVVALAKRIGETAERGEVDKELKEFILAAAGVIQTHPLLGEKAAVPGFRRLTRKAEEVFGPTHFFTLMLKAKFAELLYNTLRNNDPGFEECVQLYTTILDGLGGWGATLPWRAGTTHLDLGRTLNRFGRYAKAEEHLRQAVELFRQGRPAQAESLPHALQALAVTHALCGDPAKKAEVPRLLAEALDACRKNPRVAPYRLAHQLMDYGRVRWEAGKPAAAAALFAEAAAVRRKALGEDHIEVGEALAFQVAALRASGEAGEAAKAETEFAPFARRIDRDTGSLGRRARAALDGKPIPWGSIGP